MCTSYDEYQSQKYFPALDGIRAISILLVITVHLYYTNFSWSWLSGWSGVTIFFVLSGYLITMLSLREEQRLGLVDLRAFYIRRAFRIFPLYFLILGVYCLLIIGFGFGGDFDYKRLISALPYYLLYVNEYAPNAPFYQSWSLGIEEKFYLVWPFLAFVPLRNKALLRLSTIPIIIGSILIIHSCFPETRIHHYYPILLGCLLAFILHIRRLFRTLSFSGNCFFSIFIWGLFIFFQLSLHHLPYLNSYYPLVICLLLLNVIMNPPRWLKWQPLVLIGERSYGIYLIHLLCLRTVKILFPPNTSSFFVSICGFLTGTVLSYLVAELLYRTVEGPCIQTGRRLSSILSKNSSSPARIAIDFESGQ